MIHPHSLVNELPIMRRWAWQARTALSVASPALDTPSACPKDLGLRPRQQFT